jgi:imidazolonepropionase-like amidohydrolase
MRRNWLGVLIGAAVMAGCQTGRSAAPVPVALAIENVTVIDPETKRVMPGRSVYVDGGRIVAVAPASGRGRYIAAKSVEGTGRFLMPGLMDMHVHLFLGEPPSGTMNLLLANGVTGIREMSSDCWEIAGVKDGCVAEYKALQARVARGEAPGPELLRLTGTMVMGPASLKVPAGVDPFIAPANPEDARRLARYFKGRGVDIVKTHDSIPRDVFFALMGEARRLGLEVSGHVPFGAGAAAAAEGGYGSIEHARDLLYDCSRYGPALRRAGGDFADRRPGAAKPANLDRLRSTVAGHDPSLCAAALGRIARTGAYYVPTHVTREMEALAADPSYRRDPRRKYIPIARDKAWEADLTETAALPEAEREALDAFFRHGLLITGLAHRAGIPVMAGTDANDTMIVPGFSLHRELGLLVRAGLTPMDALRAATSVPAAYLGRSATLGGIAPGKEADLVLLRANPLVDIANAAAVEAVISDGRLFDRLMLDALLAEAERIAAGSATRPGG